MSERRCTLCDLETPDPPITSQETEGIFCCSGCLHVYELLDELDDEDAERIREQTIKKRRAERGQPLPEEYEEAFFHVEGMHCSTCESFIETLASRQDGIYRAEASYASEMAKVYYDPNTVNEIDIPPLFSRMGYSARTSDKSDQEDNSNEVARLLIGGFFGVIGLLLYVLFLYPTYLNIEGFIPVTETELLFFASNIGVMTGFVLCYTGFPILRGAWVSLSVGKPNMDLLITIAALSAFFYSTIALLMGMTEVYFDVTMAIILVVSIGNFYEKKIKSSRQDLLTQLQEKKNTTARVQRNGHQKEIPISEVKPNDHIIVKAGERIPVDGTIIKGEAVVNEALMTGESVPVTKQKGDKVLSGTILTQNLLTIQTGDEVQSTIDQLMRLMWNIQSSRPGKQRLADRIATYFVPSVILLGIGTFLFHLFTGTTASEAMLSSLAVLIVSCPCALGLATPLAISAGIRSALKHEIIFKTAAVFEDKTDADITAFDKTGTLTTGQMHLIDEGENEQALRYAAQLEQFSSHPIARPISSAVTESPSQDINEFSTHFSGVSGIIESKQVLVGKPEWLIEKGFSLPDSLSKKVQQGRAAGNVPVAVGWENEIKSIIIVGDKLRTEAHSVVKTLQREGKQIAIITGDSQEAANNIQQQLNPEFLFSETKPESKSNIIQELRNLGKVAMIGDGSNDAPALAEADLGVAFGDLTAIAAESAPVVIPNDHLELVPAAFKAIRLTKNRIRQNLGWAFLYNIITIPLAIAGTINPLFAAVAMASSSLLVVGNSSRRMKIR